MGEGGSTGRTGRHGPRGRVAVRTARPEDADAVSALLAASYGRLLEAAYDRDLLAEALPLMTEANPALLAAPTYYLALDGAAAVGCGGWTADRPGDGGIEPGLGHLRHFAVHPDRTGEGIGRALFARCLASARAAGVRRFEVLATLNAREFYGALGFAPREATDVAMGGTAFPALRMVRDL